MAVLAGGVRASCLAAPLWVLAELDAALARLVVAAVALDAPAVTKAALLERLNENAPRSNHEPYAGALAGLTRKAAAGVIARVIEAGFLEERDGTLTVSLAGRALLAGWVHDPPPVSEALSQPGAMD